MNLVQRVIAILTERTVAIVGAMYTSQLESTAALQQADYQDQLEERARQLDQDGKPQLAAALRERARQISPDRPAAQGLDIIRLLEQEQASLPMPLLEGREDGDVPLPNDAIQDDAYSAKKPTVRRSRRISRKNQCS